MVSTGGVKSILVVEDSEPLLSVLARTLRKHGFDVVACPTGRLALEMANLRPGDFAAVLTDYHMPGMSGTELIEALRSLDPGLPAVILTGDVDLEDSGVDAEILAKPCGAVRLVSALLAATSGAKAPISQRNVATSPSGGLSRPRIVPGVPSE
jgi:CheY-like chemotaxis protein